MPDNLLSKLSILSAIRPKACIMARCTDSAACVFAVAAELSGAWFIGAFADTRGLPGRELDIPALYICEKSLAARFGDGDGKSAPFVARITTLPSFFVVDRIKASLPSRSAISSIAEAVSAA